MKYDIQSAPTSVLINLRKQNRGKPNRAECPNSDIACVGISCSECPLLHDHTIGDVRRELDQRDTPTESHKGGGAGIYTVGKPEPMEFIPDVYTVRPPVMVKKNSVDEAVYSPKHYAVLDDVEAIQVIARSMTIEQFKGYCLGNIIKYRMRLGSKDSVEQDLKKAENYKEIFEKYKGLCHE